MQILSHMDNGVLKVLWDGRLYTYYNVSKGAYNRLVVLIRKTNWREVIKLLGVHSRKELY